MALTCRILCKENISTPQDNDVRQIDKVVSHVCICICQENAAPFCTIANKIHTHGWDIGQLNPRHFNTELSLDTLFIDIVNSV